VMVGGTSAALRALDGDTVRMTDTAVCPYCGETIVLGECVIVATETVTRSGGGSSIGAGGLFEGLESDEEAAGPLSSEEKPQPRSGLEVSDWAGPNGEWPIIHAAPLSELTDVPRSRWSRLTTGIPRLASADELGPIEDLPARLCPRCETPLPADVDDRELLTIAVVGVQGATKTHYLASMLHTAYHDQALYESIGCTEFAPDEQSAKRFHEEYYLRLFAVGGEVIRATPVAEDIRFKPLAFRATFRDGTPRTLLFHDVAGEVFTDRAMRNRMAPFLRRADGVIFLVDPQWIPRVGQYLENHYGIRVPPAPRNQADLMNAVTEEINRTRDLSTVPTAVVVSKSDLVAGALGGTFMFDKDAPVERDAWMTDMNEVSDEVEGLLGAELRAPDLLAAIRRIPHATYHAVAPLGIQPKEQSLTLGDIRPRRCLDPLVSVLNRITESAI
jgi:hypothetical protein